MIRDLSCINFKSIIRLVVLIFFLNVLIPMLSPFIGLGINENYFFYRHFGVARLIHFITSIKLFLGSLLLILFVKKIKENREKILIHFKNIFKGSLLSFLKEKVVLSFYERIILLFSLLFQMIYIVSIPIGFECDSVTYYQYAKAFTPFTYGVVNFDRPPLYPLIISLSGAVIPGTFIFLILLQAIFGIFSVLVFNRILLFFCSKKIAFVGSILFILCGISFAYAKLILAEQSFLFFCLLGIYFFIRSMLSLKKADLLLFYLFIFLSSLIRWESIILIIFFSFFLTVNFFLHKKALEVLKLISVTIFLFFSLTLYKAYILKDTRYIGSLTERSGQQLFWMTYSSPLSFKSNNNEISCNEDPTDCIYLYDLSNGEYIKELYNKLVKIITEDPKLIKNTRNYLNSDEKYNKIFGQYLNDTEGLVNNFFNHDSSMRGYYYATFIVNALEQKLGKYDTNLLLTSVYKEAILKNKIMFFKFLSNSLDFVGLKTKFFFEQDHSSLNKVDLSVRSFLNIYHYLDTGYDMANCASTQLPKEMWVEYNIDRELFKKLNYIGDFQLVSSFSRNLTRFTFGIIFFLITMSIPFIKIELKYKFTIVALVMSCWSYMLAIGVIGATIYSRQEILTIPIFMILGMIFINNVLRQIKEIIKRK